MILGARLYFSSPFSVFSSSISAGLRASLGFAHKNTRGKNKRCFLEAQKIIYHLNNNHKNNNTNNNDNKTCLNQKPESPAKLAPAVQLSCFLMGAALASARSVVMAKSGLVLRRWWGRSSSIRLKNNWTVRQVVWF